VEWQTSKELPRPSSDAASLWSSGDPPTPQETASLKDRFFQLGSSQAIKVKAC
jgi:hypothetical protein